MSDIREVVEWDWAYTTTPGGQRLHHIAEFCEGWDEGETRGRGLATCGLRNEFAVPGMMARMGMDRCRRCCDRLGIKRGVGSPKNDDELRPWVEKRLEAAA